MLSEQKERIIKIIEAIDGLPNSTRIKGLQYAPDNMDNIGLPACLLRQPPNIDYQRKAANKFHSLCVWDLYLFIRKVETANTAQAESEAENMLDKFAEQFLTRPQLQYNDQGLSGVVGNTGFKNTQGLSTPLTYPIRGGGTQYWGGRFSLSITHRATYDINISGA